MFKGIHLIPIIFIKKSSIYSHIHVYVLKTIKKQHSGHIPSSNGPSSPKLPTNGPKPCPPMAHSPLEPLLPRPAAAPTCSLTLTRDTTRHRKPALARAYREETLSQFLRRRGRRQAEPRGRRRAAGRRGAEGRRQPAGSAAQTHRPRQAPGDRRGTAAGRQRSYAGLSGRAGAARRRRHGRIVGASRPRRHAGTAVCRR